MQTVECDILVVGSGAGGLLAAARAHDLGMSPCIIEKAGRYGGTSALSGGGIWIPVNAEIKGSDTAEEALKYLRQCTRGAVDEVKLNAYLETGPILVDYLAHALGIEYYSVADYPDYLQHLEGARTGGRTMFVRPVDGKKLGEDFFLQRESAVGMKLLGRIAVDSSEAKTIVTRAAGRWRLICRIVARYWLDVRWRLKTHRDSRLTGGSALVGGLRAALKARAVPMFLGYRLSALEREGDRVIGARAVYNGVETTFVARKAVVLACGGFERSEKLREKYLPKPTSNSWTVTPQDGNTGDGLSAALEAGADTEFLDQAWWAPTMRLPARNVANVELRYALFFERQFPHSLCVNRNGRRFVNEGVSYNDFVQAMLADHAATGANLPCWMIFDSRFRQRYAVGGLMPASIEQDSRLPPEWWDTVIYRAGTIAELAEKILLPADALKETVERFNRFAERGVDEEFNRGGNAYDRRFADPRNKPNPGLGAVASAPFYAIPLDAGDIGTKGGVKIDEHARVLSTRGLPIPGLYAVGNCSGAVTGASYPGAGATLGSAMIFAYRAIADIHENCTRD